MFEKEEEEKKNKETKEQDESEAGGDQHLLSSGRSGRKIRLERKRALAY